MKKTVTALRANANAPDKKEKSGKVKKKERYKLSQKYKSEKSNQANWIESGKGQK